MRFTRRNALIALGSACATGGAVVGTGALTSVEATRTVDINVEGDNGAFVGLYATSSSSFVDMNSSALRIRLNGDFSGSGSGVNHGNSNGDVATTTIFPAFTLANQSPDTMYVRMDHSGDTGTGNDAQFIADDRAGDDDTSKDDATANDVIADTTDVAFMDRDGTTAVTTSIHSGGTTTSIPEGGYLTMPSTSKVDVILQIASDGTTTGGLISTATIEAYSSEGADAISGWSTVSPG